MKKSKIFSIVKRFIFYGLAGFGLVTPIVLCQSCGNIVTTANVDGVSVSSAPDSTTMVIRYE